VRTTVKVMRKRGVRAGAVVAWTPRSRGPVSRQHARAITSIVSDFFMRLMSGFF
jgi:hypothetical protein